MLIREERPGWKKGEWDDSCSPLPSICCRVPPGDFDIFGLPYVDSFLCSPEINCFDTLVCPNAARSRRSSQSKFPQKSCQLSFGKHDVFGIFSIPPMMFSKCNSCHGGVINAFVLLMESWKLRGILFTFKIWWHTFLLSAIVLVWPPWSFPLSIKWHMYFTLRKWVCDRSDSKLDDPQTIRISVAERDENSSFYGKLPASFP